jgi:iron complex transport system ATP-binding protein
MSGIVEVDNLSFGYTRESTILKDISFEVKPGTFLAIAGPNGAGKSTLLNLMCGMLTPGAGAIRVEAEPIESYSNEALAAKMAVVRQEYVPAFGFTVIEMVLMARTRYLGAMGFESRDDRKAADEALDATDTAQFAFRSLSSLSGGERQRVFIARALAQDTSILLLDEPTSFLDLKHQVGIYDLLKAAQLEQGKTIVTVTHDINLASQYCDEMLLLGTDGSYHTGKAESVLSRDLIKKVFDVEVHVGTVGRKSFFIPLGKFARDSRGITGDPPSS